MKSKISDLRQVTPWLSHPGNQVLHITCNQGGVFIFIDDGYVWIIVIPIGEQYKKLCDSKTRSVEQVLILGSDKEKLNLLKKIFSHPTPIIQEVLQWEFK